VGARALADLPLTVELDGVLYCHATPRSDDEVLTRISSPERWEDALAGVEAPLVVAGHTHQQDDRVVGDVRFANAGARMLQAGWPDQESITAALVEPFDPMVVTTFFEDAIDSA
jgi:predicted phosphodiesterase